MIKWSQVQELSAQASAYEVFHLWDERANEMLTETDRQIVREFQRRLADVVPILDLRVFGSRARDDAEPDSDLKAAIWSM